MFNEIKKKNEYLNKLARVMQIHLNVLSFIPVVSQLSSLRYLDVCSVQILSLKHTVNSEFMLDSSILMCLLRLMFSFYVLLVGYSGRFCALL